MTFYLTATLILNLASLATVYTHLSTTQRMISVIIFAATGLLLLGGMLATLTWYEIVSIYLLSMLPNWVWIAYRGTDKFFMDSMSHTH
jgi:hypothetical protein